MPARAPTSEQEALAHLSAGEPVVRARGATLPAQRNAEGRWIYSGTSAEVPAARDVTLAEIAKPRIVARTDDDPEAVLFSLQELREEERLNWILQEGTPVTIDGAQYFWLSWPRWQERANQPVGMDAPESGPIGMRRRLATVERELRLARHQLDVANRERLETLLVFSQIGWTRRSLGELVGVTSARIQQLLSDVPDDLAEETLLLIRDIDRLIKHLPTDQAVDRDSIEVPRGWDRLKLSRVVSKLLALELLEDVPGTHMVSLTPEARAALERKRGRPSSVKAAPDE